MRSRQIARWLLSKPNINVVFHALPWGDTPFLLNDKMHDGLIGEISKRCVDLNVKGDVSIQLQLPNEWDPNIAKYNVGVTAGVETDKCNPSWIKDIAKMNSIIVPSHHAAACFTNTMLPQQVPSTPIHIIPEAFVDEVLKTQEVKLPEFSTKFNFLVFGQLTGNNPFNDRKNIFFTIKWLCETFKDDPDVGIVLKTNVGRNTIIDRKMIKNIVTGVLNECRKGMFPRVHLLHGEMSDAEVVSLYRQENIKALVTLTRGEGFGLPILEAAACNVPIIAPAWSGYMDFMSGGKFISIDHKLAEIHQSRIDDKIFMKGARWAEVVEEDFKKRIKKFRESPDVPKQWAIDLGKKLIETHSIDAIKKHYDQVLGEVIS